MLPTIHYLNTDLDLTAPCDLAPLAQALAEKGLGALHVSQVAEDAWCAVFETDEVFDEPQSNIKHMLAAIESLSDEPGRLWQSCTVRDFHLGYECGDQPHVLGQSLDTPTLARIAAVGGAVRISLYAADRDFTGPDHNTR